MIADTPPECRKALPWRVLAQARHHTPTQSICSLGLVGVAEEGASFLNQTPTARFRTVKSFGMAGMLNVATLRPSTYTPGASQRLV